jgi:hypothetical protein
MKKIWSVAFEEYVCWLLRPRMMIIGVLLVFIQSLAIEPLVERSEKMGVLMNGFEPFVAVGNSGQLVMLIPFVFLILLSDYPKITSNSMLQISRTGKTTWLFGEILFICLAIFTVLFIVLFWCFIGAGVDFGSMEWSDAVTKYDATFPDEYGNFASRLLPSNLYNQISLTDAFLQTFGYLFLYLLFLSLLMYLFRLSRMSAMGLLCSVFVITCGVLSCALRTELMWIFPMAHTIPWLHYEEIIQNPIVPIWITDVYWLVAIGALLTGNIIMIRKYNFLNLDTRS